jgi:hypothetical protein
MVAQNIPATPYDAALDRWVTEKVAAPIVGKSVYWLQKRRWRGDGPPYSKAKRSVAYRVRDLIAYMESRTISA